jgi:tetratricopeptide (TPR) repeat protein
MYQQQQDDLKKNFTNFHNDLGVQFLFVERIDAAKNEFNQVLKVDPLNQNASRGLFECDVFSEVGNISANLEVTNKQLNALLNENINDPLPYLYLGDFALALHQNNISQLDKAKNFYITAISLNNSIAAAYAGLGTIYNKQNETDDAIGMYKKAINLSNWNEHYRNNLAHVYYDNEDYQNASLWYKSTLELNPNFLLPYYYYSNSLRFLGYLEQSCNLQERQIKLLENNSTKNQTINQGIWSFHSKPKKLVALNNYDMKKLYAYYNMALTYYLLGNVPKSLEYLKKANDLYVDEDSKSDIIELLNSDINKLQEKKHNFMKQPAEFINKFE